MAPERSETRWSLVAALACLAALILGTALRTTSDWDVFWHVRTGHELWAQRSLLPTDPFSYSRQGQPWPYKDVVADVLLSWGFDRIGYTWFAIAKGLGALAMAIGLFHLLPPDRRRGLPTVAVLGLLLCAMGYRIAERPLLFSLSMAPTLLALFERLRRADDRRPLIWIVAMLWLWAQLHREVLVGLVLFFAFSQYLTLARWLSARWPWLFARRPSRGLVISAQLAWLMAIALCLLNPSGASLYRTTIGVFRGDIMRATLLDWQSLPPATLLALLPAACVLALAALGALGMGLFSALRHRQAGPIDAWHLGCWLLFCERTLDSVRWMPYLCICSAVIILLSLDGLRQRLAASGRAAPRGLALLCCLALVLVHARTHPEPLGIGERPRHFPKAALRYADQQHLHVRVANAFPFGGYLLWYGWPRYRVQVDGRNDMVYPPAYMLACRDAERDAAAFARMRAQDGADWVLAENGLQNRSHEFLAADPGWALVFYSEPAVVYVRRDAYPTLAGYAYVPRLLQGATIANVVETARAAGETSTLLAELERLYADTPDEVTAHLWLAQAHDALGPDHASRRDEIMRHLARVRPDYVSAAAGARPAPAVR